MSLFAELKRRNVLRASAFYAASAWLLVQVATQVFPFFHIAEWVVRWIVVAAVIGLPFALAFAWFYEFTPQGLKRESGIGPTDSATHHTGKKLDRWIVAVLGLAVVLLLADKFVLHKDANEGNAAQVSSKSIAVLPFVNMSGDPENEYFSDGITEEILNALAQIPDLKVAARTSAFAFKGKEEDLRKVGDVLDVATVLEGSVQRAGDEVRITAQLIDTRSGYHLWSEKYDRKLTSIFAVEDEISRAIADKLRVQLSGGEQHLVAQKTVDARAHDFYLRGLALLAERGPGLHDAAADFQQAVAIAPGYAEAWAALAEVQALLPSYFLESPATAYPAAQTAAQRALALDPDVALAYVALGYVHRGRWEWPQADAAFGRALALAPGAAEVVNQHAQFLLAAGQLRAGLIEVERARRLDPLSGIIGVARTDFFTALHRYDDAAAQIGETVAAHPRYALARFVAADVAIYRRDYAEAEAQLRIAATLVGEDPETYTPLVAGIADPSMRDAARKLVKAAPADALWGFAGYPRIRWLAMLGDRDGVLDALEHVSTGLVHSEDDPWQPAFDPIRNDPGFKAALKKMGLPYTPQPGASK